MDLDLPPQRRERFLAHLQRVLTADRAFRRALLSLGIESLELSEVDGGAAGFKQKLRVVAGGVRYPTKVEVSCREEFTAEDAVLRELPLEFRRRYQMKEAVPVAGYAGAVALWQKVLALSRRQYPQTRDVFDIAHLRRVLPARELAEGERLIRARTTSEQRDAASGAILGFTVQEYRDQTVAFLPRELRKRAMDEWNAEQVSVWEWMDTVGNARG